MTGHATVSHGFSLGAAETSDFDQVAELMAASGVSLITHGGGVLLLPPVKRLRAKGVRVFAGKIMYARRGPPMAMAICSNAPC